MGTDALSHRLDDGRPVGPCDLDAEHLAAHRPGAVQVREKERGQMFDERVFATVCQGSVVFASMRDVQLPFVWGSSDNDFGVGSVIHETNIQRVTYPEQERAGNAR